MISRRTSNGPCAFKKKGILDIYLIHLDPVKPRLEIKLRIHLGPMKLSSISSRIGIENLFGRVI